MPNSDDVFKKIAVIRASLTFYESFYEDVTKLMNE
jgi:hypothetical protein